MVHDNDSRIVRARPLELSAGTFELVATQIADDREVPKIPGQRARRYSLRGIQADDRRPRNPQHRFDVFADETSIIREHRRWTSEAERSLPPGDVVIPRDDDELTMALCLLDEYPRPLKFP